MFDMNKELSALKEMVLSAEIMPEDDDPFDMELFSTKIFEKYVTKRMQELIQCIEQKEVYYSIGNTDTLFHLYAAVIVSAVNSGIKPESLKRFSWGDIHRVYQYNKDLVTDYDEQRHRSLEMLKTVLIPGMGVCWESLCISYLLSVAEERNLNKNNFLRLGDFRDEKIMGLLWNIVMEQLMCTTLSIIDDEEVNEFSMEGSIERLSKEIEEFQKKEIEYSKKIQDLKAELEKTRSDNNYLKAKLQNHKKLNAAKQQDSSDDHRTEIYDLKKKIGLLEKDLKEKDLKINELKEEGDLLTNKIEELRTSSPKRNMHLDYNARYLFVGGYESTLRKLRALFPNSSFVSKDTMKITTEQLENLDCIIYLSNFMNHSVYHNIRNRVFETPELHIKVTGVVPILKKMDQYFSKEKIDELPPYTCDFR